MPGTTDIELPEGFTARPARLDDAEAVAAVIAASESLYTGQVLVGADDVLAEYSVAPDLARDSLVVLRGDRLVAEMFVVKGRYATGTVHPEVEGHGIGTAILLWSQETARRHGGTVLGAPVADANKSARELFLAHGYERRWSSWTFAIRHREEPRAPELPPGIEVRSFQPGEEATVHRLIEDAFAEWEDGLEFPLDEWRGWAIERRGFEPWMLPVAVAGGEIVGAAFLVRNPNDTGWVQQLAVRADRRSRGLGRALLQHAFGEFHRHRMPTTALATDSRSGARTLYERAGMRLTASYTQFERDL